VIRVVDIETDLPVAVVRIKNRRMVPRRHPIVGRFEDAPA